MGSRAQPQVCVTIRPELMRVHAYRSPSDQSQVLIDVRLDACPAGEWLSWPLHTALPAISREAVLKDAVEFAKPRGIETIFMTGIDF